MSDTDRILGRLQEFKEQTQRDLGEIKRDVKALQHFKGRILGAITVISFIVTGLIQVLQLLLRKGIV